MSIKSRAIGYFVRRLQEPSTWIGIIAFATALIGYNAPPEIRDALVSIGVAVGGMLAFFIRESGDVRKVEAQEQAIAQGDPPTLSEHVLGDGTADRDDVPAGGHDDGVRDDEPVSPAPERRRFDGPTDARSRRPYARRD